MKMREMALRKRFAEAKELDGRRNEINEHSQISDEQDGIFMKRI